MKQVFIMSAGLICCSFLKAQVKEGTIYYEQKVNMHRTIQDEQMKAMMPEFRTSKFMLLFSDSISLYKTLPEDEAPDPFGGSGPRMVFRMAGSGGDLFKNFAQAKSIQTSEVGGKNYLIVDSIQQQPWKLAEETRQVLGYTCHKATRKIMQAAPTMRMVTMGGGGNSNRDTTSRPAGREVEVTAWYASDIISPAGPENYGQLPGVILQLDIDNGTTVYTATEIAKKVDTKELKEPKKGKTITRAEYQQMMREMMGNQGGGNMRISRN